MSRIGVVACLLFLSACGNPFSTREPEPPESGGSNFINPSSPDVVFINLQIALQERNVENYVRSFVDTSRSQQRFEFIADQGVMATQPGTFLNWSLEDERRYLQQLFQATPADSVIRLNFDLDNRSETASTATLTQTYTLEVRHRLQSESAPADIRGQATFFLERNETGDWAIFRWQDFKVNTSDFSWSELKAFFQ